MQGSFQFVFLGFGFVVVPTVRTGDESAIE